MKTAGVYIRLEPELKEKAEIVLRQLGLPMSNAITLFLSQLIMKGGLPFDVTLPAIPEPVYFEELTQEEINERLEMAMEDYKAGRVVSFDEVKRRMLERFGEPVCLGKLSEEQLNSILEEAYAGCETGRVVGVEQFKRELEQELGYDLGS